MNVQTYRCTGCGAVRWRCLEPGQAEQCEQCGSREELVTSASSVRGVWPQAAEALDADFKRQFLGGAWTT